MILDPDKLLRAVRTDLLAFAEAHPAEVFACEDEFSAMMKLASAPDGFVIVLNDDGDENISDHEGLYMVNARIRVSVGCNPGLGMDAGDAMLLPEPGEDGRMSLLAMVALVRTRILEQTMVTGTPATAANVWTYRGREIARLPGGVPLRAYRMTFTLNTTFAATELRELTPPTP